MQHLTIDEIVSLWTVKYKYDHILHGFKIADEVITEEKAHKKLNDLKNIYGDLI